MAERRLVDELGLEAAAAELGLELPAGAGAGAAGIPAPGESDFPANRVTRHRRPGRWCKRCSRRHTAAMGCGPAAPCAVCGEDATRRLRMTQLEREVDYQTGVPTGQERRTAFMVPFCEAHGPGDELAPYEPEGASS